MCIYFTIRALWNTSIGTVDNARKRAKAEHLFYYLYISQQRAGYSKILKPFLTEENLMALLARIHAAIVDQNYLNMVSKISS